MASRKRSLSSAKILASGTPPDERLPEAHICSLEVVLPDYSSSAVLSKQLKRALDDMDAGGGFGLQ